MHARAFTWRIKELATRGAQALFRLPRGSTLRSLREWVELLKLACLTGQFGNRVL